MIYIIIFVIEFNKGLEVGVEVFPDSDFDLFESGWSSIKVDLGEKSQGGLILILVKVGGWAR